MINLKKNDKFIIIVAVAVIVVAAIGIAAYDSPDENGTGLFMSNGNIYTVNLEKNSGTSFISEFAGKNAPYNEPYTIDTSTGNILTKADFQITWHDDKTIGVVFKRGLDTLTAEINPFIGESKKHQSKGSGNETLSFDINDIPSFDSIEAEDHSEAMQKVYDTINGMHTTIFDITINVKTGEPLRRPLKYFTDNGNKFEIKVTFEYYSISLTEEEGKETGSEGSDDSFNDLKEEGYTSEEFTPPFLSMIIETGCGRYI